VGGVSAGAVTRGVGAAWRTTSGSSASRSTRKRAHRRSPGDGERSVVHEQVDRPERGARFGDQAVDVVIDGEVGADRDRASALGFDRRDRLVDRARKPVVEDLFRACDHRDCGAFTGEEPRDGFADAPARAGHDGDATVEPHMTVRYWVPSASAGSEK
jgi:hypothetical protein